MKYIFGSRRMNVVTNMFRAKHVSVMMLSLSCALALSGCGGGNNSGDESQNGGDEQTNEPSGGVHLVATISHVASAPFEITECVAILTQTTDASGNSVPHLYVRVHKKNTSSKKESAIEVRFVNFDAFGANIGATSSQYAMEDFTVNGNSDPNEVNGSENTFDSTPPNVGKVTCTPAKAGFSDGTSWSNPALSGT
jgi:hypothetical protein